MKLSVASFTTAAITMAMLASCMISSSAASFDLDLGNKRLEGTHALTSHDVSELGLTGVGSGQFVLVTEFFYGGVLLVDVEEQTSDYIVPTGDVFTERGGLGVTVSRGHILVASGGALLGNPFEIYVYNRQGELINTCLPPAGVDAGFFNDFEVVGDLAYVTDSVQPRLWNFNIPNAIAGDCVLEYQELESSIFDPAVTEGGLESNGIVSVGNGFLISQSGSGGVYYVNPTTDVTVEVIPEGTMLSADGMECVEEDNGTMTLYVTVGNTNDLYVYKVRSDVGCEVPHVSFVSRITNVGYDSPATSAVLGDMIYTANLRGATVPFGKPGEENPDEFAERFTLVGASRLVGDDRLTCETKASKGSKSKAKKGKK